MRGIWQTVIPHHDPEWVTRVARLPGTNEPLGDFGDLVRKMIGAGIDPVDIARFARIVGCEAAFGLLYLLEDPTAADADADEISWGLFESDPETGDPIAPIACAYEDLLTSDPTGTEMRPSS